MSGCFALIVGAGRSDRFGGDLPKQYSTLVGLPIFYRTVATFISHPGISGVQTVIHPADKDLYENTVEKLSLIKKSIVVNDDVVNFLESNISTQYDIIFLDPPYKDKNLDKLLLKIDNQKILNKNGVIIIHRHKNEQDIIPKVFQIIEQKKYGISKITFLTKLN